jgi:uncharacterized membrane protein
MLSFDQLHPVVVHFPIGLLTIAPIVLAIGWLRRRPDRAAWLGAGLLLIALGTAAIFLAVETGEATAAKVPLPLGGEPLLHWHQEVGEALRWVFLGLGLALAVLIRPPARLRQRLGPAAAHALFALLFVAYLGACGALLRSAHLGGRLVHELGVRAWSVPAGTPPVAAAR